MIDILSPDLQQHESLKDFSSADDLAKSYTELKTRVSTGGLDLLPEDVRKDPSLSSFKTVGEVAKSYVETKKLVGQIKHAPAKPEEYKFTSLSNLHPGIKNVEGTQKFLASTLHELDIDNERADKIQQKIITALDNGLKNNDVAIETKRKEVETALRQEWGTDYEKNSGNIENILTRVGAGDLAKSVKNDPIALKAIHKITSLLSEDSIGKLGDTNQNTGTDKESALRRIEEIKKEHKELGAKHPMFDSKHKDSEKAVKEWNDLHQVAYA